MPRIDSTLATPHADVRSSPVQQRWWSYLPTALLLATTFALAFFELSDYDIWYHLKTGQLIPQRGVPQKDWYCFKSENEDWIDVHWGFQRVAAVLYDQFGSAGLVWMKSVAATLAMAFALSAYRKAWPRAVQALVWIIPLLLMSSRFYERPEIFTLVFTAIYLHILFHAEEHPDWLWSLPIVQVLWANVQGLFVFGPILLGMYWAEAVLRVDRVRGLFRHLMPVTLLVFAACFVSPYGWRNLLLVMQISQTATTSVYKENIAELHGFTKAWAEGARIDTLILLLLATLAISVATTLVALPTIWRERRLFRLLPLIAFGVIGFQAIRNVGHYALVAGTLASWNLASLNWRPGAKAGRTLASSLLLLGLFYAVASQHWFDFAMPDRALGIGERQSYYPHEGMGKAGMPGMPRRALVMHNGHAALYEYMNFVQSDPDPRKTFADARLEVHSLRTFMNYLDLCAELRKPGGSGDAILRAENIDVVCVDGDQHADVQAAMLNNSNWVCVHYDEVNAVFLHKSRPLPQRLFKWDGKQELFRNPVALADLPLEAPSPPQWFFTPPMNLRKGKDDFLTVRAGYVWEKMAHGDYASPENIRLWNMIQLQAARRAAARRPWKADSYRNLGYAALDAWRPGVTLATATELPDIVPIATATFNFKQALRIDPSDFYARFWLGQTYMLLGAYDLAERELQRLKSAWPRDRQQVKVLAVGGQLDQTLEELRKRARDPAKNVPKVGDDPDDSKYASARRALLLGDATVSDVNAANDPLTALAASVATSQIRKVNEELGKSSIDSPQTDWLRAWLAIQAGERDAAHKAVAAGKARKPSGTTALALDYLEQMVK